jgi:peptidoglycan/xylan/chitin deacetylase (PgdA/CDA1 family)
MSDGSGAGGSRRPVISEFAGARVQRAAARRRMRAFMLLGAAVLLLGTGVAAWTGVLRLPGTAAREETRLPAAVASVPTTPPAAASATTAAASAATTSAPATSSAIASESVGAADADVSWMDKYRGKIIDGFKTEPGYKAVALTFDDGPNGETQSVIDALAKVDGRGTFFFTGRKLERSWAKTQPSIISKGGFELANHTQHHTLPDGVSSLWRRSYKTCLAEINGPDEIIERNGGQKTIWLRPMGGMIDKNGVKAADDTDHLVVNWTVDSNDSHGGPRSADYIYKQCTANIKSGDVVLLHVTHPESMEALSRIVATLDKRGFKLVTLTELAKHSTGAITERVPK